MLPGPPTASGWCAHVPDGAESSVSNPVSRPPILCAASQSGSGSGRRGGRRTRSTRSTAVDWVPNGGVSLWLPRRARTRSYQAGSAALNHPHVALVVPADRRAGVRACANPSSTQCPHRPQLAMPPHSQASGCTTWSQGPPGSLSEAGQPTGTGTTEARPTKCFGNCQNARASGC